MNANDNNAYSTIICDEDKLKLGNDFLSAFKNRDWDLLRSIITDDCIWWLAGSGELAGQSDGPEEIINKAKQFVNRLSLQADLIQASLNCVTLGIYNKALTGIPGANEHIATVSTIRDGKISRIISFFFDVDGVFRRFAKWAV